MSTFLAQLEADRASAKRRAESILSRSKTAGRKRLTTAEARSFEGELATVRGLDTRIKEERDEERRKGANSEALRRIRAGSSDEGAHRAYRSAMLAQRVNTLAPLAFDPQDLRRMHEAIRSQSTFKIEARNTFSSPDSLLPSELFPLVVGVAHESRIIDRLPAYAMDAPTLEYIMVPSVTGAAAIVAEGAQKPELVMNVQKMVATATKLAVHTGTTWESLQDYDLWQTWVHTELMRQVVDVENSTLINSTATGFLGFLGTSGILTHDASTDTGTGVTGIDSIEKSIATMRVGGAYATPDLMITSPAVWSALRRLKDTTGRALLTSMAETPAEPQKESLFGMDVLVTVTCPAGTAILVDTTKFGRALVREPLSIRIGYDGNDFSHNIVRSICEERLTLAVERPAAILSVTNLPVA